jgi:hypothetical protein
VKFTAIATIATAAALSLGMAASASASPLSPRSATAPQVTGTRLQSALLPASAFGSGFTAANRLNTGKKLWSTRTRLKPSNLSCKNFEMYIYVGGFGDTAGAVDNINNPDPDFASYPSLVLGADQAVIQFKTAQAATSFYNQAYTRYKQCSDFTESYPGDSTTLELTTQTLAKTTIKKDKAFQLVQDVTIGSLASLTFYQSTAVVLAGTNVYTIDNLDGTNDPISASLLGSLINRVQALYKHH